MCNMCGIQNARWESGYCQNPSYKRNRNFYRVSKLEQKVNQPIHFTWLILKSNMNIKKITTSVSSVICWHLLKPEARIYQRNPISLCESWEEKMLFLGWLYKWESLPKKITIHKHHDAIHKLNPYFILTKFHGNLSCLWTLGVTEVTLKQEYV